jgi:hypothetical protein
VRCEIRNTGASTSKSRVGYYDSANGAFLEVERAVAGGTVNFNCCSVQTEGGEDLPGFPRSANSGTTLVSITTRRPLIAIRPKATFNSRTNRGHIDNIMFDLYSDAGGLWEVVIGGTLGGGTAFTSVNADSIVEYDTGSTTLTGGVTLVSGYVSASSGKATAGSVGGADLRYPLVLSQIDALAAVQTPVSMVVTRFSGATSMAASMNWHEQVC